MTVIDYRTLEQQGLERAKQCPAGAEPCRGNQELPAAARLRTDTRERVGGFGARDSRDGPPPEVDQAGTHQYGTEAYSGQLHEEGVEGALQEVEIVKPVRKKPIRAAARQAGDRSLHRSTRHM